MGIFEDNDRDFVNAMKETSRDFAKAIKETDRDFAKAMNTAVRESLKKERRVPIPPSIKKQVFDKFKGRCKICSLKNPLEIHHKNMKSSDNKISNLILLCPNHHTLEHQKDFKKTYAKDYHKKKTKLKTKTSKKKVVRKKRQVYDDWGW